MSIVLVPGGFRSVLLIQQAYEEEGLACPDIDENHTPVKLLYPRSFVTEVEAMPGEKVHDYAFVGSIYRPETYANRAWILDYARQRFTDRSYFLVTDQDAPHQPLGPYDRTTIEPDVFVPKETPPAGRAYLHRHYFAVLRASQFTLCPAGDRPWSMRFFEAIMCRSIPVVSDLEHVGRNALERSIGYHVYLHGDEHAYDPELAEENHRLFLRHQTLIDLPTTG